MADSSILYVLNNSTSSEVWPAVPVLSLSALILLVLFVFLVRSFVASKEIGLAVKSIVVTTVVLNISCVVGILALAIIVAISGQNELSAVAAVPPISVAAISYVVGKMGLEMFSVVRARDTFKNSVYAVSQSTVWLTFGAMFILAMLWIYTLLVLGTGLFAIIDSFDYTYYCLILTFGDALFMTFLLLLFTRKLGALVVTQGRKTIISGSSHCADFDISDVQLNLDYRQTRLISVITRCILLSVIAFLTTIAAGFGIFLSSLMGGPVFITHTLWSLDVVVNSVCLYLNFVFAANLYQNCCGCCHKRFELYMEYRAAKLIVRSRKEEQPIKLQSISRESDDNVVPDVAGSK